MNFESNVLGVKVRLKKMIVALATRIYLVDFFTLEVLHILPTIKFNCNEAIMPVVPLNIESRIFVII